MLYIETRSPGEVAKRLNMPIGTVKSWATRGGWLQPGDAACNQPESRGCSDSASPFASPVASADRSHGLRTLTPYVPASRFADQLYGAFVGAGLDGGLKLNGEPGCSCPACPDSPVGMLDVTDGAARCPACSWEASGELEEIVSAGKLAKAGKRAPMEPREDGLPPIMHPCDFVERPPVVPPDAIKGVLRRGSKMLLAAGSKSWKSWVLLDLALSIATGYEWLGFEVEQGKALFVNFELQDYEIWDRVKHIVSARRMGSKLGHSEELKRSLGLWNLRGKVASLSTLIEPLIQEVKKGGYTMVIIDPVYNAMGELDENCAADVNALMIQFESIAACETRPAVVFAHHFAKGNAMDKQSIDRMSGSGVWARNPDAVMSLTKPAMVKVGKGRDATLEAPSHDIDLEMSLRAHAPVKPSKLFWGGYHFSRQAAEASSETAHAAAVSPSQQVARCLPIIARMPETRQTGGMLCDCVRWVQSSCGQMSYDEAKAVWEAARMIPEAVEPLPDNWWRGVKAG